MKEFFKNLFSQKKEINYLYFSCILIFLILLSLFHFIQWGLPSFFLLYATGQAIFETFALLWIAALLRRWTPRWLYLSFIALSFLTMRLHFTNFTVVRLLDAPISYVFKFLFSSGIAHLITAFSSLNMNGPMTLMIVGTVLLIPFIGLFFYFLTGRLSRINPFRLSLTQITAIVASLAICLFCLDLLAHPLLSRSLFSQYQKALPLGTTLFSPEGNYLTLPAPLLPFRDEQKAIAQIPLIRLEKRPNIYFFIIETLRQDYVNDKTAPHLTQFGKEHHSFPDAFANANATHPSWFSLFHSNIPHHWTSQRDHWEKGSIPLQYFKKLGYTIRTYTSTDLSYFGLKELIFGKQLESLDHLEDGSAQPGEPCDRDALAFAALERDSKRETEGNLFLIFLDSTHSEYSFPKDMPLPFQPISQKIDYLSIGPHTEELELAKNRYRNAIYYLDSLFGHFFEKLKKENLFDDAIISITGDHGEEFFEEGALFHGTHLNHFQTAVPILLKFPCPDWTPTSSQATHIDLLPTILHYLTGQTDFSKLCDGRSLFAPSPWPYRIAVLQNGPDTPLEFSIQGDQMKLRARFANPTDIYKSTSLEMVEWEGREDFNALLIPLLSTPEEVFGEKTANGPRNSLADREKR